MLLHRNINSSTFVQAWPDNQRYTCFFCKIYSFVEITLKITHIISICSLRKVALWKIFIAKHLIHKQSRFNSIRLITVTFKASRLKKKSRLTNSYLINEINPTMEKYLYNFNEPSPLWAATLIIGLVFCFFLSISYGLLVMVCIIQKYQQVVPVSLCHLVFK